MTRQEKTENLSIYTIPAGQNFARAMVGHFLEQYKNQQDQLGQLTLLLPTRRACRSFQDMFLQQSEGQPLLLPKIQPLGDVDEQDLSLSLAGTDAMDEILALPPAMSSLQRRIILAQLIAPMHNFTTSFDQALGLADALAVLLDQIIIEGLDIENLANIVPEDFADHWQITLDFLKILTESWPKILADMGVIEAADRRNRLMHILVHHWAKTRPTQPIYAAGSTGSIPATAALMKVVASLPNGHIVLPGLDQGIDDESWQAIEPSHPQYGLKHLLDFMEVPRTAVKLWPATDLNDSDTPRSIMAREMMRPSLTTKTWITLGQNEGQANVLKEGLEHLSLIEADNQREESLAIALEFRKVLEDREQTAVLVTPDRKLARRVSNHCRRWGIKIDDSAGESLSQSATGIYLKLLCEAALSNIAPLSLLELIKHDLCRAGWATAEYYSAVHKLERLALRGLKPAPGFDGLSLRLKDCEERDQDDAAQARSLLGQFEPIMTPFITLMQTRRPAPFSQLLKTHLAVAEALATTPHERGESRLWGGEAGESAAALLSELSLYASHFGDMDGDTYKRVIQHFLNGVAVRPRYGTHPRLSILGQLEARLIDADVIILGSLNEGTWPPEAGHDPWMSRPMRQSFGLPDPDRAIGLAAHDFMQGFCSPCVIMTRSKSVDGTMTVPARWLQRLDTVVKAAGLDPAAYRHSAVKSWIEAMDKPQEDIKPIERPRFTPPLDVRPKKLSVTKIDTWLKDPYAIYAGQILKLKKLDDLEKPMDLGEMGTLLHAAFENFVKNHKGALPANSKEILMQYAQDHIEQLHEDPAIWSFWWPRFSKICDWYIAHEKDWRDNKKMRPLALEVYGEIPVTTAESSMILNGKIDRIDLLPDGRCAIIDYKSGGNYTLSKVKKGELPQLPLEALMLETDGFAAYGIKGKKTASLHYWIMSGGSEAGNAISIDETSLKGELDQVLELTRCGLENMITVYGQAETPYICLPKAHAQPKYNDYAHFERIAEWAALEDDEEAGEFETGAAYG